MTAGFESIAFWSRDDIDLGNEHNITTDKHAVSMDALKCLDLLKEDGYGGEGKIFPTKGFIRPIKDLG